MSNYVRWLLSILLLCSLPGCKDNIREPKGVEIEFKIQNPLPASSLLIGDSFGYTKVDVDSASGNLVWQRDLVSGPLLVSAYFHRINNGYIYMEPGDKLKLEFDGSEIRNSLKSLNFEGDRKIENEFLISIKQVFNKESSYEFDFYNYPENVFVDRVDSLRNYGMEMIDLYTNEHPGNREFEHFVREYVHYTCALYLNNYPQNYRFTFGHRDYRKSNSLEGIIEEAGPLERTDLIELYPYVEFLLARISDLSELNELNFSEKNELKIDSFIANAMDLIDSLIITEEIRQLAKYKVLQREIYLKRPALESFYVMFQKEYPNSLYALKLQEAWKDYKILSKGFPAPSFEFADVTGQFHNLDSFRGKWVYMDVWATWCGPCLAQQPRFEELIEKYRNNDRLVFLGISIDEDVEAWKRMVKDREMGGIQLYIQSDPENSFRHDYMISGIPKYLWIDPNGLVYDVNAKRPSDPELVDEIDYLLSR